MLRPSGSVMRVSRLPGSKTSNESLLRQVSAAPLAVFHFHWLKAIAADPKVFVYAAGGYYYPGKGLQGLADEMKGYLDRGYTVCKMKIGGASLDEDLRRYSVEVEHAVLSGDRRIIVNGREVFRGGKFSDTGGVCNGNCVTSAPPEARISCARFL